MTKLSRTWWDRFLFRDRGFLPTMRLILLLLLLAIPNLVAAIIGNGWRMFFVLNGLVLFGSLIDLVLMPRKRELSFEREVADEVERGQVFSIYLRLSNLSNQVIYYTLVDDLPESFKHPFPLVGKLASGMETIYYHTLATERGDYQLNTLYFRYRSKLGLWEKQMTFTDAKKLRVIPDMSSVRDVLQSAQSVLKREGIRIKRNRVGTGEFASIRSYVVGDDPRRINWHQTARRQEVMTNIDEPEHGKHVMLLIDCGRVMGVELTKSNRLERSIEAALTVATAALRGGDHVGVIAFSNEVHVAIPPRKGISHLQTIIKSLYAIQTNPVASHYARAFEYLETMQKRRSLVVFFSHLDMIFYDKKALLYGERLRRRHFFLMLSITDPMIKKWIGITPAGAKEAMIKSMAQKDALFRKREINKLEKQGLHLVEVPEDKLAISALSQYFSIINRDVL